MGKGVGEGQGGREEGMGVKGGREEEGGWAGE